MPLYYMQVDDDETRFRNDEGIELDGPSQARIAALEALPDMVREQVPDGDRRIFTVNVRDEDDQVIYSAVMTFVGQWHTDHG